MVGWWFFPLILLLRAPYVAATDVQLAVIIGGQMVIDGLVTAALLLVWLAFDVSFCRASRRRLVENGR